jgi:hypothetical protein
VGSQLKDLRLLGDAELERLVDGMATSLGLTLPQPADKIVELQRLFRRLTGLRNLRVCDEEQEGGISAAQALPGLLWALHAASPTHAARIQCLEVQFEHAEEKQYLDAGLTGAIAAVLPGLTVRT